MAKKIVKLKMKNYNPNSQIIEVKISPLDGYLLSDPATGKTNTELELFKNKNFKSDENKDFKDKKEFTSVEFRIIAEQRNLILYDGMKVIKFDETATPMFTDVAEHETQKDFIGVDPALEKLVQDAIFPFIVLTVTVPGGEVLKNDLASLKRDSFVKIVQKAEGDSFSAMLELDNNVNNIDLAKLRIFEGSKSMINADNDVINSVSSVGYDSTKDITWKLQVKFRGFEIEDKGTAKVAV